jgi:protein-arginine kinase activator protein McsA
MYNYNELLKLKGYNVIGSDFMECIDYNSYDKIVAKKDVSKAITKRQLSEKIFNHRISPFHDELKNTVSNKMFKQNISRITDANRNVVNKVTFMLYDEGIVDSKAWVNQVDDLVKKIKSGKVYVDEFNMYKQLEVMQDKYSNFHYNKPFSELTKSQQSSMLNRISERFGIDAQGETLRHAKALARSNGDETVYKVLKQKLDLAVEEQKFEDAVVLRDKIKNLEENVEIINELNNELNNCIKTQDFERAIEIRDKINTLK